MAKQSEFIDRTRVLTKDLVGRLSDPDDLRSALDAAAKQYSSNRPYTKVADKVGTGINDVALPTDWLIGFSSLESVEFPIGDVPATMLDAADAYLYQTPTALMLRIESVKLSAAQTARITYTMTHDLGTEAVASTIPDTDFEAVCCLAASICCDELATSYAQGTDSSINADVVDGGSRGRAFADRAIALKKFYTEHMGLTKPVEATGAGSGTGQQFVDLDTSFAGSGTYGMTHSRKWT
jgi:hypothetical protein